MGGGEVFFSAKRSSILDTTPSTRFKCGSGAHVNNPSGTRHAR